MRTAGLAIGVAIAALWAVTSAQRLQLPEVPDSLPPALSAELLEQRKGLQKRIDAYNDVFETFRSRCASVRSDQTALMQECSAQRTVLLSQQKAISEDADRFKDRVLSLFTGTRSYHLTAKSWIDPARINEWSERGLKFLFEANTAPLSPQLAQSNDFKIFQTFVVEVKFVGGSIVSARFLSDSLDQRAGATVALLPGMKPLLTRIPIEGQVRVTDQKEAVAPDKRSVSFRRTVEANPSLWILVPDAFDLLGSTNFRPISNTVSVTVTAKGAEAAGSGTAFPSHRFWIGDTVFRDLTQGQPSEYFGSR